MGDILNTITEGESQAQEFVTIHDLDFENDIQEFVWISVVVFLDSNLCSSSKGVNMYLTAQRFRRPCQ